MHTQLHTTNLTWRTATKTKPLRAKPLISLIVERKLLNKFLVDTIEGKEPLRDGVVICLGINNDAWQQMPKKLLGKYDVTGIDDDGWMICEPKPDNAVDCHEILASELGAGKNFIIGHYGETLDDGTQNTQACEAGDYICRDRQNPTDQWIVKRKIFENTYSIKD